MWSTRGSQTTQRSTAQAKEEHAPHNLYTKKAPTQTSCCEVTVLLLTDSFWDFTVNKFTGKCYRLLKTMLGLDEGNEEIDDDLGIKLKAGEMNQCLILLS